MKARGPFGWPSGILPAWLGGTGASRAAPNAFFAGPASGSDLATPGFRALTTADISGLLPITGGFKNLVGRNGGLEVWQRGAGGAASIAVAASTTAYTVDGWAIATGANQASTVTQAASTTSGSRWCAIVQRNAGQTGTGTMSFEFPLDVDEIAFARLKVVTLSLVLNAGANWSPASGNLTIELRTGTGLPAKRSAGAYTSDAAPISVTQSITSTATRYIFTSTTLGASVSQASIYLTWTPTGTAGAQDWFVIDDVQLEIGTGATTFERSPFSYELERCARHFQKTFAYTAAPAQNIGVNTGHAAGIVGAAAAATCQIWWRLPTRMRVGPTTVTFNPSAANAQVRNVNVPGDHSAVAATATETEVRVQSTGHASGTVGQIQAVHITADAGI